MTPEERAEIVTSVCNLTLRSGLYDDSDEARLRALVADAIREAVKAERERCLAICHKIIMEQGDCEGEEIEARIRGGIA